MSLRARALQLGLSGLFVLSVLGALVVLEPGHPQVQPGADMLSSGTLCAQADPMMPCAGAPVTLPFFGPFSGPEGATLRMEFNLPSRSDAAQTGPMALYFPLFSDGLDVFVNDVPVLRTAPPGGPYWHWNRPAYVRVPGALLNGALLNGALLKGGDRLTLILHGAPRFETALMPVHFGPDSVLRDRFAWRRTATLEVARLGLGLTLLCSLAMIALAVVRRRDGVYKWAALSGLSAAVLSLHYAAQRPPLPELVWQVVWTVSVPLLVAALHRFIRRFLRRPQNREEHLSLAFVAVSAVVMTGIALWAPHYVLIASAGIHAVVLGITFYLLAIFLRDRRFTTRGRFLTLYGAMCITAALALHDALFLYPRPPLVAMQLGQFMPLVFMFVTGWLVLMQLVTALNRQEALAGKLRQRVIDRSRALRRTTDRLEVSERETLLAGERERIMMDLHDGVGGHLVNALAGLRQAPHSDPQLREVLEQAQTDLGLMVDSLYNPGDVVVLLGALRARVEPLLERQGLRFDWQVEENPRLPDPGPSANIDLLRIVQEFVTNTLKHADAACIRVQTGARHLCLADDGRGISPTEVETGVRRGHGLASMRRRAGRIGAQMSLTGGAEGTVLRLDW